MSVKYFALQAMAAILVVAGLAHAQTHEPATGSSVQLGDKVVVIPAPEGYEEASTQFKEIKDRFVAMEAPGADFLFSHLPIAECQTLRSGRSIELGRYTKVSVAQEFRNVAFSESDMATAAAAFRKNSGALFDPDGPIQKAVTENASHGLSVLASKPIELGLEGTKNLGEFDSRPNVFSALLLITYKVDSAGTQSTVIMLSSLTLLTVKQRLIYVTAFRKISSPAALTTELKPGIAEMKQFTTNWVNKILVANKEDR